MKLHNIYFSAKGTTEICAACIVHGLNMEMKPYKGDFEKMCSEYRLPELFFAEAAE